MPYTDWNYTNPGWTNNNPPAINESNLNDISDFLTKFDYYIWKRQKYELETYTQQTTWPTYYSTGMASQTITIIYYNNIVLGSDGQPVLDGVYATRTYNLASGQANTSEYNGKYFYDSNNTAIFQATSNSYIYGAQSGSTYQALINNTTKVYAHAVFADNEDVYITQNKDAYTEGLHDGYLYTYLGTPMDNIVGGVQIIQYIGNGQNTISFGVPENFKAIFYATGNVVCSPITKGLSQIKAATSNTIATFNYTISNDVLEINNFSQTYINQAGILYSLICIK